MIFSEHHTKHHLPLHHLHIHRRRKSVEKTPNEHVHTSSTSEGNKSSKRWTEEEIKQRQLIEQYVFSKLEAY